MDSSCVRHISAAEKIPIMRLQCEPRTSEVGRRSVREREEKVESPAKLVTVLVHVTCVTTRWMDILVYNVLYVIITFVKIVSLLCLRRTKFGMSTGAWFV